MKKKEFGINFFFFVNNFFIQKLLLFANVTNPDSADLIDISNEESQQIEFYYSVTFHAVSPLDQFYFKQF